MRVPSNEFFFFNVTSSPSTQSLSLCPSKTPPLNFTVMLSPSRISATASAALSTRRGAERGAERGQASSATDDADDDEVDSMGRRSSVRALLSSARWERSTARRRALALAMVVQRERETLRERLNAFQLPRARASKENREKVFLGRGCIFSTTKNQKKNQTFFLSLFFSLLSSLLYESESTQTIRMIELVRSGRSV